MAERFPEHVRLRASIHITSPGFGSLFVFPLGDVEHNPGVLTRAEITRKTVEAIDSVNNYTGHKDARPATADESANAVSDDEEDE